MQLTVILGRRLLYAAALIAAVVVLNFFLIRLAPGDPALTIAGEMGGATEEIIEDIRRVLRAGQASSTTSSWCT